MNFDLETRPDIENIKEPREFNSILIGKKNTFVQYSTSIVLVPISLTVTAITPLPPPKKKVNANSLCFGCPSVVQFHILDTSDLQIMNILSIDIHVSTFYRRNCL